MNTQIVNRRFCIVVAVGILTAAVVVGMAQKNSRDFEAA